MNIKAEIKKREFLKQFVLRCLMPQNQARPRRWVKWFVNPFFFRKGKRARIQKQTRMDILPIHSFSIGNDSTVEDYCTINNGMGKVSIGNNARIGIGSVVIGPVEIADNVRLAQNVVLTALNHNYENIDTPISEQGVSTEEIYIGEGTWIGANAVVLPGVYIGKHCVVAAGSVVTKSVPSHSVVAGNPAKIIKQHNPETNKWERSTGS